ncbi:MAG TPA: phosphotransferase [Kofleriaceae bacterium]|nr:phosphotransferase [Kofleriaceae bacterium]
MEEVAEIARRHGLRGEARRYPKGTQPVFAIGEEHVVKLFPPASRRNGDNERDALALLGGRLPVATPELRAAGELGTWSYLVMTQLHGAAPAEMLRYAAQLGATLRALHALDADARALPHAVVWDELLAARRAGATARAAGQGADPAWVARIDPFLASVDLAADARVFLHTEVMPAHLLAAGDRLTGLVDFEPAMFGPPEYELTSIGLFVSRGDPAVLRAVVSASGLAAPGLARRLMAYALLHRYANLRWYLAELPPAEGTDSFEELAAQWFGH